MESKALNSVLRTEATGSQVNEVPAEDRRKKTEAEHEGKEAGVHGNYEAISKNGDTLELSDHGKKLASSGSKIADNILAGYSDAKIKQLYTSQKISRQQYERIVKLKKAIDKLAGDLL